MGFLVVHGTSEHGDKTLIIDRQGPHPEPEGYIRCTFECLFDRCNREERKMVKTVPRWLVNAAALAFHSGHEGHRMRITVGAGLGAVILEAPP